MGDHFTPNTGTDVTREAMAAELLDAETEAALARSWRDERYEAAPGSTRPSRR